MIKERQHKHHGVERTSGTLRAHSVNRKHIDKNTIFAHNNEIRKYEQEQNTKTGFKKIIKFIKNSKVSNNKTPNTKEKAVKLTNKTINVPIDCEGYIYINMSTINEKGCKIQLERYETINGTRVKRLVGVKFSKE